MVDPEYRCAQILLVEDSSGDVILFRKALEKSGLRNELRVIENGAEAESYLQSLIEDPQKPRPGLAILDINLPAVSGLELLRLIKTNDALKSIPVIVMTTSSSESDIQQAYASHANSYITKPVDFPQFLKVVSAMSNFWLQIVTLPNHEPSR